MKLTQSRLVDVLAFDQETGHWVWRLRISQAIGPGATAGCEHPSGYRFIKIDGVSYAAHRLAWLYVFGEWPTEIDHRDGNRSNNAISNLRQCDPGENQQNVNLYRNNSSGCIGVGWHRCTGLWRARIDVGGKQRHLGLFSTKEQARAAYLIAKSVLHTFQPVIRAA